MDELMVPLPAWVVPGAQVRRKPDGRSCRVVKVSLAGKPMALVRDGSTACWVSARTFVTDWAWCGRTALQELLERLKDVSPSDLPPSLRDLREAWIEAGCEGLRG